MLAPHRLPRSPGERVTADQRDAITECELRRPGVQDDPEHGRDHGRRAMIGVDGPLELREGRFEVGRLKAEIGAIDEHRAQERLQRELGTAATVAGDPDLAVGAQVDVERFAFRQRPGGVIVAGECAQPISALGDEATGEWPIAVERHRSPAGLLAQLERDLLAGRCPRTQPAARLDGVGLQMVVQDGIAHAAGFGMRRGAPATGARV